MKKQKNLKRNILLDLWQSYIWIAVIALVLNVSLYLFSVYQSGQIRQTAHEKSVVQMETQARQQINDCISALSGLSADRQIKQVLGIEQYGKYVGSEVVQVKDLLEQFGNEIHNNAPLSGIALYDLRHEAFILRESDQANTILHGDKCSQYLLGELKFTGEMLTAIREQRQKQFFVIPTENGKSVYFTVSASKGRRSGAPDGVLIGLFSDEGFENLINRYTGLDNRAFLISSKAGYIGTEPDGDQMIRRSEQQGFFSLLDQNLYTTIDTSVSGLSILVVTESDLFSKNYLMLLGLIVLNIVGIIGFSIWVGRRHAERNAEPLRRMLRQLDPEANESALNYTYLEDSVASTIERAKSLEARYQLDFLALLLNGQETDKGKIRDYVERNVRESREGYYVLIIRFKGPTQEEDIIGGRNYMVYFIQNVFSELLEPLMATPAVISADGVCFVIQHGNPELFTEKMQEGVAFTENQTHSTLSMGLSNRFDNFSYLNNARKEAGLAADYADYAGQHKLVIHFGTILGRNSKMDYGKIERLFHDLFRNVLVGEYIQAKERSERLYNDYLSDPKTDVLISRAYMISLTSLLEEKLREHSLPPLEEDYRLKSVLELHHLIQTMLEKVIYAKKDNKDGAKTFEDIAKYIQQHCTDSELTATAICERFGLSYGTVTALVKRYTGGTVMDYLNRVRVDKAKELLDSGKSVSETAEFLGFSEPRGLIRVFKKIEGITPGRYKKEKQGRNEQEE